MLEAKNSLHILRLAGKQILRNFAKFKTSLVKFWVFVQYLKNCV